MQNIFILQHVSIKLSSIFKLLIILTILFYDKKIFRNYTKNLYRKLNKKMMIYEEKNLYLDFVSGDSQKLCPVIVRIER